MFPPHAPRGCHHRQPNVCFMAVRDASGTLASMQATYFLMN
jgi:hypothetical protein